MDSGDFLPSHWERTHREEFFRRLAPNWTPGKDISNLDFSIASYFKDVPNTEGFLELKDPNLRPLMAFGDSPIGEALVDWRCFYLGSDQPGGKCRNNVQPFGRGWDYIAPQCDLEWGCRRPFLIIITDGENNCKGENPAADTANLRRNRIQAWVINFGGPDAPELRQLAVNTGGEYISVSNRDELLGTLENILGQIIEQTRAFASAVVPTVQAEEADKIFVSNFKPLNQESVWPGNVQAFLKPVPIDGDGKPNTSIQCGSAPGQSPESQCFLWNSGEEMLSQVQPLNSQFGLGPAQRRVFYSRLSGSGKWPDTRRFLEPTEATAERYDLWRAFGLIPPDTPNGAYSSDPDKEDALAAEADAIITEMMVMKVDDNDTPEDPSDDTEFILGDIFHSDPLILGSPSNTKYFALNLKDDGSTCEEGNPSYRCFFRKHQNRRKILMVGSNDGSAHAFDAGIFRSSGPFEDTFDRGSGKEVFAFVPRTVMPTIEDLYGVQDLSRDWTVDGSIVGFDAFIDPLGDGALFPNPDEREWRTLVLGGLRRGGRGYYALDVTQPDPYDADGAPTGVDEYVPACAVDKLGLPEDCGPISYPSQLWEFTDSWLAPAGPGVAQRELSFDRNLDGIEDFAETWSTPNLGLIKVCDGTECDEAAENNDVEDRFVAIFGGGLDKTNSTGNWLYIVDVETGKAIYKRELVDFDNSSGGAAVAEPAAVDTDGDGYLDRIYVATLKGFIYRVDLRPGGAIPALDATETDWVEFTPGVPLPIPVKRITDDAFAPRIVFKAQPDPASAAPSSRAIYYRPSVIFMAGLGQYALAFGVGDRENLWSADGQRGHFYVFRDDTGGTNNYYTEEDLVPIDSAIDGDLTDDLLTDPTLATKGWYLLLRENERLITNPFAVSGVVVFTVFDPDVLIDENELTCSRTGRSRVFGVTATNANGLLFSGGVRTRWFDIADFVTEPYIEQSATKNPEGAGEGGNADELTEDHLRIMEELKKLFPQNCKFANYRLDIKTLSSDTGIHLIAPIPICIVEKNWKEF